jgi:ankyrin repeat protein
MLIRGIYFFVFSLLCCCCWLPFTVLACCRYGHEQVMKNLLGSKYGSELVNSRESLGATPLHLSAAAGHLDCCLTLINSNGQPSVDAKNVFGQTPLMLAASKGGRGTAVLDMLITAGANPKVQDADGK